MEPWSHSGTTPGASATAATLTPPSSAGTMCAPPLVWTRPPARLLSYPPSIAVAAASAADSRCAPAGVLPLPTAAPPPFEPEAGLRGAAGPAGSAGDDPFHGDWPHW